MWNDQNPDNRQRNDLLTQLRYYDCSDSFLYTAGVDILEKICRYLKNPKDISSLAQTCKSFYNIFEYTLDRRQFNPNIFKYSTTTNKENFYIEMQKKLTSANTELEKLLTLNTFGNTDPRLQQEIKSLLKNIKYNSYDSSVCYGLAFLITITCAGPLALVSVLFALVPLIMNLSTANYWPAPMVFIDSILIIVSFVVLVVVATLTICHYAILKIKLPHGLTWKHQERLENILKHIEIVGGAPRTNSYEAQFLLQQYKNSPLKSRCEELLSTGQELLPFLARELHFTNFQYTHVANNSSLSNLTSRYEFENKLLQFLEASEGFLSQLPSQHPTNERSPLLGNTNNV